MGNFYKSYGHNHHVPALSKRTQGKVCAYCGRKIDVDPLVRPNLNGMGPNTIAHRNCAQKAGVR